MFIVGQIMDIIPKSKLIHVFVLDHCTYNI